VVASIAAAPNSRVSARSSGYQSGGRKLVFMTCVCSEDASAQLASRNRHMHGTFV
jgi:hypothetical protein